MTYQWEVRWSPFHEDQFLTCGPETTLYSIIPTGSDDTSANVRLSDDYEGIPDNVLADFSNANCITWAPKPLDNFLAIATPNGHIVISNVGKSSVLEHAPLVGKDLSPRHSRPCTGLDWNKIETNLIAQSLEKHHKDSAILIWDLNNKILWESENKHVSRSFAEVGLGESSSCICWFQSSPKSFIAGVNNKLLRIYDLRDTARPRTIAYSKGVMEVKVDPCNDYILASCSDSDICIWDTRSFDKPVVKLYEGSSISHLRWSPSRSNLLGCITGEPASIHVFDLQKGGEEDESENTVSELTVNPFSKQGSSSICSFDWHPLRENEILASTFSGELGLLKVFEKISVSWSCGINLAVACGHNLAEWDIGFNDAIKEDVSIKFIGRALNGYGIQPDVVKNADLVDDPDLKAAWKWLKDQKSNSDVHKPIEGLATLFPSDQHRSSPSVNFTSEERPLNWQVPDGHQLKSQRLIYVSQPRSDALSICGWSSDFTSPSTPLLDTLHSEGEHFRAVAISIFTLRLGWAIQTLHEASNKFCQNGNLDYSLVAMAVAGFSDAKDTLWKELCQNLTNQINDPYIRAVFTFLTSDNDDITPILSDEAIHLADRLALACMYLPDSQLTLFVEQQTSKVIATGDLNGLFLTGLGSEGKKLLQQFLDTSSDVQTVAALVVQTYPTRQSLGKDDQANLWVECYRELLDRFSLWHQRCDFDVFCGQLVNYNSVHSHVYLCCNFCGKTVGYNSLQRRRGFILGAAGVSAAKITSCPECRRPLPRCAVCLLNMGTASVHPSPSSLSGERAVQTSYLNNFTPNPGQTEVVCKVAPLCDWFSWCQSCRHGGHLEHMNQWFTKHSECPVTGCTCQCNCKDTVQPLP